MALYKRNSDPATAIIQAFQYHEAKRAPTSLGYLTFDRCAAFVLTTVPVRHVEGIAEANDLFRLNRIRVLLRPSRYPTPALPTMILSIPNTDTSPWVMGVDQVV